MNRIDLTILGKTKTYEGATCWEELKADQYEKVCKVLLAVLENQDVEMVLPHILFRIPMKELGLLYDPAALKKHGLSDEQIADALSYGKHLMNCCQWVFETLPTRYPVADFHRPGPGDGLKYMTFEEFMYAERCYEQAREKPFMLLKLIAILHRTRRHVTKGDSDPRVSFMASLVERQAKRLTNMPEWLRFAILIGYEGARKKVTDQFKYVFPKQRDDDEPPKKGGKNPTWFEVALSLAGEDVQKFQSTEKANLYLVLAMLDKAIQRSEELAV